jgi:hypothetical protein
MSTQNNYKTKNAKKNIFVSNGTCSKKKPKSSFSIPWNPTFCLLFLCSELLIGLKSKFGSIQSNS